MNRKGFFKALGISLAAVAALTQLESCNKDKVQRIDFTIDLNDPENFDLTTLGGYRIFNSAVIVAKDVNNNYIAFSAYCTYDACLVEFQTTNEFICPCCQSHYDTDGNPMFGYATSPLEKYNVQQTNNILHVYS